MINNNNRILDSSIDSIRLRLDFSSGFRIRKNIRYLNDEELHDILQAFAKFKNDPTEHGYLVQPNSLFGFPAIFYAICVKSKLARWSRSVQAHYILQHISGWHGWPFVCPWNKAYKSENKTHCSWHHHPLFLSWHRLFAVQFELGELWCDFYGRTSIDQKDID